MRKQLWTISGLAVELDRDRRTIADALSNVRADGEKAGRSAWFMTSAIRALSSDPEGDGLLDPVQERARKDRALAISAEIKNDIATGRVVPIDDAIAILAADLAIVRNQILGLASRIAPRLVMQREAEPIRALIYDEVIRILQELSVEQKVERLAGDGAGREAA